MQDKNHGELDSIFQMRPMSPNFRQRRFIQNVSTASNRYQFPGKLYEEDVATEKALDEDRVNNPSELFGLGNFALSN